MDMDDAIDKGMVAQVEIFDIWCQLGGISPTPNSIRTPKVHRVGLGFKRQNRVRVRVRVRGGRSFRYPYP